MILGVRLCSIEFVFGGSMEETKYVVIPIPLITEEMMDPNDPLVVAVKKKFAEHQESMEKNSEVSVSKER